VVQPGNRVTSYQYDPNRNRVLQTDANGHQVRMTYDELDRLDAFVQDPSGLAFRTSHAYDANGNETVLTDPKGQTVTSTYDELNRLKTKAYAYPASDPVRPWRHTTSVAYFYDANGNLSRVEDSVASGTDPPSATLVTTREYDDLDRLLSETSPLPDGGTRTVAYTYFANGTRKTVTGPSAETSSYTYDGQNRLATATTAGGVTTYAYFPDDLLRSVTYPSGVTASHAYDKADRLTSLVNARGTTTVSSFTYGYDRNGNRLSQVEVNGGPGETTGYTYDALNRLATVTYPVDANYPAGRVVTYVLDDVGNRTRETERTTAGAVLADKQGVFDNLNRLTTLTDLVDGSKTTTFTWDANGNQRTKTVGAVTTEYRYDCRDKLVEVVEGASTPGRFQYDFEGRRSKKIGSDGVVQYVYDQTSVLAEFDGSAAPVAKYEYGSDRLMSMARSGEGRRWYSLDGLRSVVNLTDDSGSTVASYHLDAWGNFRFPTELGASKNHFAFTGYEWDPELGLFNAKARYFDPQIGRFITQDSFLGQIDDPPSLHRYFHANANPTRYRDEDGHSATAIGAAVGTAWGIGQAIGKYWDDTFQGNYKPASAYFSVVAQNAIAGTEIGASIDATILTGGLGAAAAGGLGAAGLNALTVGGEDRSWSDFGKGQATNAVVGAVTGGVLSKVAPVLGKAAAWAVENVPVVAEAGGLLAAGGRKLGSVVGSAADAIGARYEAGWLSQKLAGAANPFEGLATRQVSARSATAIVTAEGKGASAGAQTAVKPAIESTPASLPSRGEALRTQYGNTFNEYARHRSQGFNPFQAKYLAEPYEGMGHHFVPRRMGREYGLPESFMESRFNVMKPSGITTGQFYERHFLGDPKFYGTSFPRRIGGAWKGEAIGLTKPNFMGRLPYASPESLKTAAAAAIGVELAATVQEEQP